MENKKNCEVLPNHKEISDLANMLYCKQDEFNLSNPYEVGYAIINILGYRNCKDKIVISKEEYEDLQTGKDFNYGYHEGENNMTSYYENIKLPQERKETAKKLIRLIEFHSISKRDKSGYETFTISNLCLREILREEFGFTNEELETIWEIEKGENK